MNQNHPRQGGGDRGNGKRPLEINSSDGDGRQRKRIKDLQNRTIRTQGINNGGAREGSSRRESTILPGTSGVSTTQVAPRVVDVVNFAEARAFEIKAMQAAIISASYSMNYLAFQSLPRGLRRRAASHNTKRLPLRLREQAKRENELNPTSSLVHPPNRRKKRRPGTLAAEYLRRQSLPNNKWLETHIWHAKRMHMIQRWGYRLAERPNEKFIRACYRTSKHLSLMHDASYTRVVEINGSTEATIVNALQGVLELGCGIGSKRYSKGQRVLRTYLYHHGKWPTKLICPVDILWRGTTEDTHRSLWAWIHPASFDEAFEALINSVATQQDGKITINELKHEFAFFEFTGPRSTALLQAILDPVDPTTKSSATWEALEHLRSSASLPPGCVLGLTVQDPRLCFPQKVPPRSNLVPQDDDQLLQHILANWPENIQASSLWDASARQQARTSKLPDKVLNDRRSKLLVPGQKLSPTDEDAHIPVILIQRGMTLSSQSSELINGWTFVLPSGWAMPFWRSFTFAGARVGGLRERRSILFEAGQPAFPYDFPGTAAWTEWNKEEKKKLEDIWKRRPPAKRVNFNRLGLKNPFECAFENVLHLGNAQDRTFWTLHNPKFLEVLFSSEILVSEKLQEALKGVIEKLCKIKGMAAIDPFPDISNALIHVRIIALKKGTPFANAMIYKIMDIEKYKQILMRLRLGRKDKAKNWKRAGRGRNTSKEEMEIDKNSDELVTDDSDDDCNELLHGFRKSKQKFKIEFPPIEELIGYITTGQYCFSKGRGFAIGAVSAIGLAAVRELDFKEKRSIKMVVLVRNVTGLASRPCLLEIL